MFVFILMWILWLLVSVINFVLVIGIQRLNEDITVEDFIIELILCFIPFVGTLFLLFCINKEYGSKTVIKKGGRKP